MPPFVRVTTGICLLSVAFATCGEAATIPVNAGDDLQRAINLAQPGDVLLLQPGATFTGNFVLPVKAGTSFITIRSAASDSDLPAEGVRITPSYASMLPKLRSNNDASVLKVAAGAHHWRLLFLEFLSNRDGYGDVIQLGDGGSAQNTLARVPTDLEVDRVYIHGDPSVGQKRGIAINGSRVTIRNSFIADCKAAGADAQAIAGWNGPGPYTIENNYLEGAAENVLFGGSDPAITGLIASDITFRRNYLSKPLEWRDPIIATPGGVTATAVSGGSLLAGSIVYTIVAQRSVGQGQMGRSTGAIISASSSGGVAMQLRWGAVSGATQYQVYGRGFVWTVTGTTFTDTGAAGAAATAPSGPGTKWIVKNLFELKNARRVIVQYNVFEANWGAAQSGYAIVFTPRNSNGRCTWCTVQDVEFSYNVVRHVAAGVNILGHDSPQTSGTATNIYVRENLFYDVNGSRWGGSGWFMQVGDSPRDLVVDHNTIDHDGTTVLYVYGGTQTSPAIVTGFKFTNNLARHGIYGLGGSYFPAGMSVLNAYFPGSTVTGNLLVAGDPSRYPPGNYFSGEFTSNFGASSPDDYSLGSSSIARGTATDGSDIGADVATILAQTSSLDAGVVTVPNAPRPVQGLRLLVR